MARSAMSRRSATSARGSSRSSCSPRIRRRTSRPTPRRASAASAREAERLLAAAEAERANAIRDFETVLAARRADEEQAAADPPRGRRGRAGRRSGIRRDAARRDRRAERDRASASAATIVADGDREGRPTLTADGRGAGHRSVRPPRPSRRAASRHARRGRGLRGDEAGRDRRVRRGDPRRARPGADREADAQLEDETAKQRTDAEQYASSTRAEAEDAARKASEAVRAEAEAVLGAARAQAETHRRRGQEGRRERAGPARPRPRRRHRRSATRRPASYQDRRRRRSSRPSRPSRGRAASGRRPRASRDREACDGRASRPRQRRRHGRRPSALTLRHASDADAIQATKPIGEADAKPTTAGPRPTPRRQVDASAETGKIERARPRSATEVERSRPQAKHAPNGRSEGRGRGRRQPTRDRTRSAPTPQRAGRTIAAGVRRLPRVRFEALRAAGSVDCGGPRHRHVGERGDGPVGVRARVADLHRAVPLAGQRVGGRRHPPHDLVEHRLGVADPQVLGAVDADRPRPAGSRRTASAPRPVAGSRRTPAPARSPACRTRPRRPGRRGCE